MDRHRPRGVLLPHHRDPPVREQEITEYQFTDAFDTETGEHIPNQDLFTVGQAEAIAAIVAGTQAIGQEAQAMEEYFQWPLSVL